MKLATPEDFSPPQHPLDMLEQAVEDINATVEFLACLAGEGLVFEFGVGIGWIALPLV